MIELGVTTFRGVMVGIEFPTQDDRPDDVNWALVLDLFIFRITLVSWKEEE